MFAVVKTGGKQYRVTPGDVVLVERLPGEEGQSIQLTDILMVQDGNATTIGAPLVSGAFVNATIKAQTRGDKIIVFKKKRRQGYRRKRGHRQDLTLLTIQSVQSADQSGQPASKVSSSKEKPTAEKKVTPKKTPKVDETLEAKPKVSRAKTKEIKE